MVGSTGGVGYKAPTVQKKSMDIAINDHTHQSYISNISVIYQSNQSSSIDKNQLQGAMSLSIKKKIDIYIGINAQNLKKFPHQELLS